MKSAAILLSLLILFDRVSSFICHVKKSKEIQNIIIIKKKTELSKESDVFPRLRN